MDIPITFERGGKTYSGHFGKVAGAGTNSIWHLMSTENRYLGRLRNVEGEWYFDDSRSENEFKYLARFFGKYIHERT